MKPRSAGTVIRRLPTRYEVERMHQTPGVSLHFLVWVTFSLVVTLIIVAAVLVNSVPHS